MSVKSVAAKIFANIIHRKTQKWVHNPIETQQKVFQNLIASADVTQFGKDHNFSKIKSFEDFAKLVPIRDYEELRPYVDRVVNGEADILWKGKPIYFAKTSGTTSGAKYIPLTKESMPTHIEAARNAILNYIHETGKTTFVDGKMIFLQGSPILEEKNGIKLGRLSGIVAHFVPNYLQKNRMPSWETNCIEDWETKVDAIVEETFNENMTVISGIPSWVQMYFEKLEQKGGRPIGEIFKNFNLFIYGGVNYEPYRAKFENLIGRKVDSIELFPASEGFFAYQDSQAAKGMLLLLNSGIFYNIGDTVQFTSLKPYRVIVSGRIKHYISAFGEHVIGKEVECALKEAMENSNIRVNEFTVAPQIAPTSGLPYHEWFIEFENEPENLSAFALKIDNEMRKQNSYYNDLIVGKVLKTLVISKVSKNGFQEYMKSIGKLGGQNKIPRLSNDRKIADLLKRE